uniref:NADH:ubiquinone reductase (H(+)-translocating) n=1 Tax=Brachionus fernandoi TaxID=2498032 RepID=A0A8K1I8G4_9BILA|nr:NADH dehydrogenase subunit 5 [Brachionus fernandoi]
MTSFYNHLLWFTVLFVSFLFSLFLSFYVSFMNEVIYLSLNLFSFWNNDMNVSFYFDYMSVWFTTIILLISSVIMVYSYFYMAPYSKSVYFLWLTNLFIFSMLMVVNMSNLFFLMLGWDGLGLVSFFLIVYYQNQSSITSGMFTLLMNRLGDSFFLVTITLFFYFYSDLTMFSSNLTSVLVLTMTLFTFMTKSAIYPFSPWLPLAMAAPTPISALVHSSTLVTAGLYLMMRFSYLLYSSYSLMQLLLILSLFTSFYAGMNSIFEKDLKKMIALSTLSHLGFIGMAFSVGLLQLAFFHMLTHALFKSLLFMTMGDIMINLNHSQDIRYLSSGMLYTPMSCMVMYVSILNLLGMPNLSGYFSKDLVLEMMNYSWLSSIVMLVLFVNVFFTYYYTYQLFFYSFQPIKVLPYQNFHSPLSTHTVCLFLMSLSTLVFASPHMRFIYSLPCSSWLSGVWSVCLRHICSLLSWYL